VKAGAGMDRATLPRLTAADRQRLKDSIVAFRPRFLAFTSKTAGRKFFDGKRDYGEQIERIGDTGSGYCRPRLARRMEAGARRSGTGLRMRSGPRYDWLLSPLVGEGGSTARSDGETDEGSVSADANPSSGASRHLLPQGEKEKNYVA